MIKIISGGQTGVDQAALVAAHELGFAIGGWCPKGGLDEDSQDIARRFSLQETNSSAPEARTKMNIRDSDGTLILVPRWPLPQNIADGTVLTIHEVVLQKKNYRIIDITESMISSPIIEWIKEHKIQILNIAGPRESSSPGIFARSYIALNILLSDLTNI